MIYYCLMPVQMDVQNIIWHLSCKAYSTRRKSLENENLVVDSTALNLEIKLSHKRETTGDVSHPSYVLLLTNQIATTIL